MNLSRIRTCERKLAPRNCNYNKKISIYAVNLVQLWFSRNNTKKNTAFFFVLKNERLTMYVTARKILATFCRNCPFTSNEFAMHFMFVSLCLHSVFLTIWYQCGNDTFAHSLDRNDFCIDVILREMHCTTIFFLSWSSVWKCKSRAEKNGRWVLRSFFFFVFIDL